MLLFFLYELLFSRLKIKASYDLIFLWGFIQFSSIAWKIKFIFLTFHWTLEKYGLNFFFTKLLIINVFQKDHVLIKCDYKSTHRNNSLHFWFVILTYGSNMIHNNCLFFHQRTNTNFDYFKVHICICFVKFMPLLNVSYRINSIRYTSRFLVTSETRELRQITYSPNRTQTQLKMKTKGPNWNSVVDND